MERRSPSKCRCWRPEPGNERPLSERARHRLLGGSAALLTIGLVGTAAATPAAPAPLPALYVAATGSDARPCTRLAPCRTFQQAYRKARPGQTVEVAAGRYPAQTLPPATAKPGAGRVLFKPLRGRVVIAGETQIGGRRLEFRNLVMRYRILPTARDVILRGIRVPGSFTIVSDGTQAPRDIKIIGGVVGPAVDDNSVIGSNGPATSASPTNVLIDGVTFRDYTLSPGSSAHVECLQVWAADGLTIRNSRFVNCWVFDVFIQKFPDGAAATPRRILIENNFFNCCGGGPNYALRLSDSYGEIWRDVTIRNNSSDQKFSLGPGATYRNVTVSSNIAPRLEGPDAGVRVDYNVWFDGRPIGPHDRAAPHGFRDPRRFDFHLRAAAAALDAGDPRAYPARDIDGDRRPQGARPDAGADEAR